MESIIAILISALMIVESNGRADAIGDNGRAIGILQIHPECVQDINRFSHTGYKLADRQDERKSVGMCWRYLYHYGNKYKQDTGQEPTAEILARIWNGGPRGYKKERTRHYWDRVQAELRRQEQTRADGRTLSADRRCKWTRPNYRKRQ